MVKNTGFRQIIMELYYVTGDIVWLSTAQGDFEKFQENHSSELLAYCAQEILAVIMNILICLLLVKETFSGSNFPAKEPLKTPSIASGWRCSSTQRVTASFSEMKDFQATGTGGLRRSPGTPPSRTANPARAPSSWLPCTPVCTDQEIKGDEREKQRRILCLEGQLWASLPQAK